MLLFYLLNQTRPQEAILGTFEKHRINLTAIGLHKTLLDALFKTLSYLLADGRRKSKASCEVMGDKDVVAVCAGATLERNQTVLVVTKVGDNDVLRSG